MIEQAIGFKCHLFICTNDRMGEKPSCADHPVADLHHALREGVELRGLKPEVRVSKSGCLGPCGSGPNIFLYPQKIMFAKVQAGDIETILDKVESLLSKEQPGST